MNQREQHLIADVVGGIVAGVGAYEHLIGGHPVAISICVGLVAAALLRNLRRQ
jgi:hypothetical protein